ncbi:hypothetical protein Tco_1398662 [Tanacetum coccineum]
MQMNLTLPEGVVVKAVRSGKHSSANQDPDLIKVDSKYAQQVYNELIYEIEPMPDFVQAGEIVEKNLDASNEGLAECKASASNLGRIQVRDIIKKVEDYLKIYSSAGMDIS